jgi:hypothetical protein
LSICGFLPLQPLSDFPSCASATHVSQTTCSQHWWPPVFPPKRNFQFDFSGRVPAVAIPNARNLREWAAPVGKYSSIHEAAPNLEPFANLRFTLDFYPPRFHRAATGNSADNIVAKVLRSFALALLYFVSRPVYQ